MDKVVDTETIEDYHIIKISYAKIGNMTVFGGKLSLKAHHDSMMLALRHEERDFHLILPRALIHSVRHISDNDSGITITFSPKGVHEISNVVKQFDFVFQISKDKSEHDFEIYFKSLSHFNRECLSEFFPSLANEPSETDENKCSSNSISKRIHNPDEVTICDDAENCPEQKRARKSPPPLSTSSQSSKSNVQQRSLRSRRKPNYSDSSSFILEDVSEEAQVQEALRRSIKTLKKENPNDLELEMIEKSEMSWLDIDKCQELFTYNTMARGDLIVRMEDYLCLDRREYLSDVDIDFYIQYIYNEKMSEDMRNRTYIFGSHFYSLYSTSAEFSGWKQDENAGLPATEKRYMRVNGIIKDGVNIFDKDFLIFPLIDRNHWFLAIVCYPKLNGSVSFLDGTRLENAAKVNDSAEETIPAKTSCVLVFDSIRGNVGRRTSAMSHIRNFLVTEHQKKYKDQFEFHKWEFMAHAPRVPSQLNNVDCGCFLLEFIEHFFIKSPITNYRVGTNGMQLANWFDPTDVGRRKREEIANVFRSFSQDSQINLPELEFFKKEPEPVVPVVQESAAVDEDTSNNNNNNENGNEEFNNNNFNCLDSNQSGTVTQENDALHAEPSSTISEDNECTLVDKTIQESISNLLKAEETRAPEGSITDENPVKISNKMEIKDIIEEEKCVNGATSMISENGLNIEIEPKNVVEEIIDLENEIEIAGKDSSEKSNESPLSCDQTKKVGLKIDEQFRERPEHLRMDDDETVVISD